MEDGLYAVNFSTANASGSGVFYVTNNIIRGGDSGMAYFGSYSEDPNGNILAILRIATHDASATSVFGPQAKDFDLIVKGQHNGGNLNLTAIAPDLGNASMKITGRRLLG